MSAFPQPVAQDPVLECSHNTATEATYPVPASRFVVMKLSLLLAFLAKASSMSPQKQGQLSLEGENETSLDFWAEHLPMALVYRNASFGSGWIVPAAVVTLLVVGAVLGYKYFNKEKEEADDVEAGTDVQKEALKSDLGLKRCH